jgi:curli biogenesis system outer membrane secretion channel CsgG
MMRLSPKLVLLAALPWLTACVQDPPPSAQPLLLKAEEIVLPPPPARALTVAIYNCIDTTGQRRPTGTAQELSSAVPMDCSPYLVEAVRSLRPGYVFLVERQHVDELLRERQLATLALNSMAPAVPIRPSGVDAGASDAPPSPPQKRLNTLRVAEILLIGQVVAYDRQTRQLSAGLALAGIGATGTTVTDLVTFSLRAVAVQTGEILGESSVTKSITSQMIGGHITRVFPTTILDLELGGGANEPVGLAMRVAIRSSLTQLVDHGIRDGWWGPMVAPAREHALNQPAGQDSGDTRSGSLTTLAEWLFARHLFVVS